MWCSVVSMFGLTAQFTKPPSAITVSEERWPPVSYSGPMDIFPIPSEWYQ